MSNGKKVIQGVSHPCIREGNHVGGEMPPDGLNVCALPSPVENAAISVFDVAHLTG